MEDHTERERGVYDDPIYCPACEMWVNGPAQWDNHQIGKKHRKNLEKKVRQAVEDARAQDRAVEEAGAQDQAVADARAHAMRDGLPVTLFEGMREEANALDADLGEALDVYMRDDEEADEEHR